jgi:hypothetical protein
MIGESLATGRDTAADRTARVAVATLSASAME